MSDLSQEQAFFVTQALDLTSSHMILSGKAGTGKSVCLRALKKECEEKRIKIRIVAPTGVAAINVGGITVDRYISFLYSCCRGDNKDHTELLVIDECSMLRADKFDRLDEMMRKVKNFSYDTKNIGASKLPFGGRKIILVGDLMQLPPVITDREDYIIKKYSSKPYFFKSKIFGETDWKLSFLTKTFRQADDQNSLRELLEAIRNNSKFSSAAVDYLTRTRSTTEIKGIGVTGANKIANAINAENLAKLESESFHYEAEVILKTDLVLAEKEYPAEKFLELKAGARVVCLKNIYKNAGDLFPMLCNGDSGEIVSLCEDFVEFLCYRTGESYKVFAETWEIEEMKEDGTTFVVAKFTQIPFRVAYCLTVHKAQGMTFEEMTIIPGNGFWETGQLYVALSRATCLDKLWIKGRLTLSDVKVCGEAVNFMNQMTEEVRP